MAEDEQHGDADLSLHTIQESDEYGDNGDESLSQIRLDEGGSTLESETSQEDRFGSPDREDHFDESASENEDNVMESAGENEMEDQVTLLTGGPKHVTCTEDSDFMEAFDKMMTDNIQARNQESLKVPQLDIAVPMNFKGQKRNLDNYDAGDYENRHSFKTFVLMTRKGTKQQFTDLNVPISDEFAAKYKERELAERVEKEKMKQVVLGIHERQEEEEHQEYMAGMNRQLLVNSNRERRVRYQHPKGAPDADVIFGGKKR